MRYINLKGISKPKCWLKKTRRINRRLKQKNSLKVKKAYITKKACWGDFKPTLERLSCERCWFSESPDWVSPFHIEHFRPKGKVDELKVELDFAECQRRDWSVGYWWLAFNWKNYRLCCAAVNTSFKRNYFPLEAGSFFASSPIENHSLERNILLDPCVESDVDLLTYNLWEIVPSVDININKLGYERARISIELYGLNKHQKLVDARKDILLKCNKLLINANKKFKRLKLIEDYTSDRFLDTLEYFTDDCETLKTMFNYNNKGSFFPSMIKTRIETSGYDWVKDFILN